MRSTSGSCVTSTKGKLEVLREHYERLGMASVDDQFDDSWKEHVEKKVTEYSEICSLQKDKVLDRGISYAEIKKCSKSLNNNKTGSNDGLVGELFKYGGKGMAKLLKVAFFLDVQKAFDTVWHDGLWFKLWELGVRGRMWRVIKNMYDITQSAVLLEGEVSEQLNIGQGVAQGCSMLPILFSILLISCYKRLGRLGLALLLKGMLKLGV